MINSKSLVIGRGEVGIALFNVLKPFHDVKIKDRESIEGKFDILHICFPYFEGFVEAVEEYRKEYNPTYIVIHSTVPIGTSKKCKAFHSPIRGIHPNLEQGILTFVKYLAPSNRDLESYFRKAKIKVRMFDKPETTEALKILSTTQYGLMIMIEKEIFKFCKENNLNFDEVYTDANRTYNEGYRRLGKKEVIRPVLKQMDGKIKGHCIINNLDFFDNWLAKLLSKQNKTY